MSVLAVVKLIAKNGKREALLNELQLPIQLTRENGECQSMKVLFDADDECVVLFTEEWNSVEAHLVHVQHLQQQGLLKPVVECLADDIETFHYSEMSE